MLSSFTESKASYPKNGIIKVYNQFPRFYGNMDEMIRHLPRIAEMGFNVVWLGPVQEVSDIKVMRKATFDYKYPQYVSRSIYAMTDPIAFNREFDINKENISAYARIARKNGLMPIFDLVLNHIGKGSELFNTIFSEFNRLVTLKPRQKFSDLELDSWDFVSDPGWDDVYKINYQNLKLARCAFEQLWMRLIDRYIEYGFLGVRLDAIKHIEPEFLKNVCQYINAQVRKKNGADCQPVILGELLYEFGKPKKFENYILGIGLTHVLNSVSEEKIFKEFGQEAPEWVMERVGTHRGYLIEKSKIPVGTVSYAGNHDTGSLTGRLLANGDLDRLNPDEQLQRQKEFICCTAFTSDCGWYALAGDECKYDPNRNYL